MTGKKFTQTSNKVELQINRVRINRARPVALLKQSLYFTNYDSVCILELSRQFPRMSIAEL